MAGDHRARRTPWTVMFVCWYAGHNSRPTGLAWWVCDRCDRVTSLGSPAQPVVE